MLRKFFLLLTLLILACMVESVLAVTMPPSSLINPRFSFALSEDGKNIIACFTADLAKGSHVYTNDPGEAGRPTSLQFSLEGGSPVPVVYPKGSIQRDYFDPEATVTVYSDTEYLFALLPVASEGKAYEASLSQLVCSSKNCTPIDVIFKGKVPDAVSSLEEASWKAEWKEAVLQRLPRPKEALPRSSVPRELEEERPLPPPTEFAVEITPVYADSSIEIFGISKALFLGFLAGLLLNIMPCVLPVLTFKVTGLLMSNSDTKQGLIRFRQHNIYFSLGVLTFFAVLALVLSAMGLMWGQLYQKSEFLMATLVLVFLMGLSMFGLFTLPVFNFSCVSKTESKPRLQAYITGCLSTLLATPCSGPLLGGVLAWAFTQPTYVLVIVFLSVGCGMSFPYLFLAFFPRFASALPRPGAWMQVAEHIVGFFILATAIYIFSILPAALHVRVLVALLVISFTAFLYGRFCHASAPRLRRRIGKIIFFVVLVTTSTIAIMPPEAKLSWRTFQPQEFVENLGTKPMVVEFTADWCPNCKFVEATVFTTRNMRALQARYGVEFVRVDLTGANAYGSKLLNLLGGYSIPVTALFGTGEKAKKPVVLRDVFSTTTLKDTAARVFVRKKH